VPERGDRRVVPELVVEGLDPPGGAFARRGQGGARVAQREARPGRDVPRGGRPAAHQISFREVGERLVPLTRRGRGHPIVERGIGALLAGARSRTNAR